MKNSSEVQINVADIRAKAREEIESALQICEAGQKKGENLKVLVFCNRKYLCDKLSEIYDCPKYYSDAPNKEEALRKWKSGLMVATGALGAGVNVDGIRWVFHWDSPNGMIEFDQEVGRGGRGGEVVKSKVLMKESTFRRYMNNASNESRRMEPDEAALNEFVTAMDCRRKAISRFMDGEGEEHKCEEIDWEVCDRCAGMMSDKEMEMRELNEVPQVRKLENL